MIDQFYSVVVAYPSRIRNRDPGGCPHTYIAYVKARDVSRAKDIGQKEAWQSQPNEDRGRRDEWNVLLVINGHVNIDYQR